MMIPNINQALEAPITLFLQCLESQEWGIIDHLQDDTLIHRRLEASESNRVT